MTTEDLRELLISASFNERAYGILEEKESAWCILFEDGVWTVAENMERMYRSRTDTFASEDVACVFMLKRILYVCYSVFMLRDPNLGSPRVESDS